ncbi:MAG: 7-cyano-7-deazaguanine synthase QueC [Planctomycetales bacterium]|nr:7-cyano-7-deazaguanine synthase QueC [Planctomycetales bacterium]
MSLEKIVCLASGGMDSATLLYHLLDAGHEVKTISFHYGQRHARELDAARQIAAIVGVEHVVADLRAIGPLLGDNALTCSETSVPHGHYEAESMKATVVPNRNMIMLSVAVGWALAQRFDAVAYGAHSGDHAIYPDCRPEFAEALDQAVRLCDWHGMKLLRPFVAMDKGSIAVRGAELGVPFHLTWTCYEGGRLHCGRCGACCERREAFTANNLDDPTEYQS